MISKKISALAHEKTRVWTVSSKTPNIPYENNNRGEGNGISPLPKHQRKFQKFQKSEMIWKTNNFLRNISQRNKEELQVIQRNNRTFLKEWTPLHSTFTDP